MQVGTDSVKNIAELFDGTNQYRIPLYQRRYVWDMTNWNALWRDLIQLQHQIDAGEKRKKHFTGTIITHAEENIPEKKDEIIDGQQRLTTFQIIFCVIRDLCAAEVYQTSTSSQIESAADGFTKLNLLQMEETDRANDDDEDNFSTYRLIPTTHDREAFQSVISGELGKQIKQASPNVLEAFQSLARDKHSTQNLIITAYGYFGTKIVSYLEEEGSHKLLSLSRTLSNNFHLIKVNLDSTDEPEKIFETINDTGRMLDDFDYLRNHLFLRARKLEVPTIDVLYNQYWKKFEEWSAERLDLFFRTFLIAKWGPRCFESDRKTIKPFDLYRQYSGALKKTPDEKIKYELQQLRLHANSYEEMGNLTSEIGNRMRFYHDLNIPSLDSFILFLKHELKESSDSELTQVLDILESYIVRRMLCFNGNNHYEKINAFFSQAIKDGEFSVRKFARYLSDTWPDSEVESALQSAGSKSSNTNLILYIFYQIELELRTGTNKQNEMLDFKDLVTLDRITSPEDLIIAGNLPDYHQQELKFNTRRMLSEIVDSIGNIIPLRSDHPQNFSKLLFEEKKSNLAKIPQYFILNEDIRTSDNWGEKEITFRTTRLLNHFNLIWPPAEFYISHNP